LFYWNRKASFTALSSTAGLGRTGCRLDTPFLRLGLRLADGIGSSIYAPHFVITVDALDLGVLGRTFDTVIDCGLFHVFSDPDRERHVSSLASVMTPGAKLVVLCFSDLQPGIQGPRRVSREEIRQAFNRGWHVKDIRMAAFESNLGRDPVKAWLSEIIRDVSPR
jgi:hypothetical protein